MAKIKLRNSVAGQVAAFKDALEPMPECPKHVRLRPKDKPFWDAILRARAKKDWIEVDLVVVAQLARCQQDIEYQSEQLDREKSVVTNARGTQIMNPRITILEQLARREMALMRALRMGGVARPMTAPQDLSTRRQAEQAAREVYAETHDDQEAEELLA